MPKHQVQVQETIQAPLDQVFAFFADHEKFATLFGGACKRVKDGQGEPNGLGSVRRMGPGPLSFDETIVTFDKPRRIEYQVTRGSPIKNHLGTIDFKAAGNTTVVDYVIRFDSKIPGLGGIIAWVLGKAWKRNAPPKLARISR